jgi:hypothetical protein|tara:strand:+ start:1294 stop:1422 length:129 start_codon:yes stop_codon:yes gene_type:complete
MNNNFNRYARNQLSMEAEQDRIYQSVLGIEVEDIDGEAHRYE